MKNLISNLLDLARLETGIGLNKEAISLKHLLEMGVRLMEPLAAEKSIDLRLRPVDEDVIVHWDAFQITQVLQNLISNAVKYSATGGVVEISAGVNDHWVSIHVADNGLGIPEPDVPHLFEKFYRVNTAEHQAPLGTGLGLSIVQEIVRQHGGNVAVESQVGWGSTFTVSLPIQDVPVIT